MVILWEISNDKHSDHKRIFFDPATDMFNEILHVSKLIIKRNTTKNVIKEDLLKIKSLHYHYHNSYVKPPRVNPGVNFVYSLFALFK